MKKISILLVALAILGVFNFAVQPIGAQGLDNIRADLGEFGTTSYGTDTPEPLPETIGRIIGIVLGLLGVVLVLLIIYGGFLYMTSGGKEDGAKKGKAFIINGIIGVLICLMAWAISSYVVSRLVETVIEQ
ncbi:TPA: hypothetical protein DF272_00515 [Candidatus Falkowbacteria bacterium]|nr:hypothetical protein [Candidatus Falkowbacteria bacterium]